MTTESQHSEVPAPSLQQERRIPAGPGRVAVFGPNGRVTIVGADNTRSNVTDFAHVKVELPRDLKATVKHE